MKGRKQDTRRVVPARSTFSDYRRWGVAMKIKLVVIAFLTFAAGFVAGLLGSNLVARAYAAENRIILITRDAEIANECNFDKTIARADHSTICVRR